MLPHASAAPDIANSSEFLRFGNFANRFDLLNTLVGVQTVIRQTSISNGIVVPLRSGSDRQYDFEYSLGMNRRFSWSPSILIHYAVIGQSFDSIESIN